MVANWSNVYTLHDERTALATAIADKRAADGRLEAQRDAVLRAEWLVGNAETKLGEARAAVAAGHALPTSALRALLSCYTLRSLLAHDKGHPAFFFDAVLLWRLNLNLYVIAEFCIGTEKAFQGEATKVASKDFG